MSALRRSDIENKLAWLVLMEPKIHIKIEMETPYSSRVRFITTCSCSSYKD
ncbi:hypothetical protein Tco_0912912, partial [Tanacetum coccineum]